MAATIAVTAMTVNAVYVADHTAVIAAAPTQPGEKHPTEAEYVRAFTTSMSPQLMEYFSEDQRTCLARLYVDAAGGADGIWAGSIGTPLGARARTLAEVRAVASGTMSLLQGDYFLGPEFPGDVARCVDLRQYAIRLSWQVDPPGIVDRSAETSSTL